MAAVALLAVGVEHASPLVSALLLPVPPAGVVSSPAGGGSPDVSAAGYLATGLAVAVCYQALLATPLPRSLLPQPSDGGGGPPMTLQHYVLHAPRDAASFVSQNREGLAGVAGFFAIYLCGVATGRLLLDPARRTVSQWRRFAWHAALLCAGLWLVFACACAVAGPVSRRLVNLPYIAWVLAFNASQLLGLLSVELVTVVYTCAAGELDARDTVAAAAVHGETGVPASTPKGLGGQPHGRLSLKAAASSVSVSAAALLPGGGSSGGGAVRGGSDGSDTETDGNSSEQSDDSAPHEGDTGSSPTRLRSPALLLLRKAAGEGDVDLHAAGRPAAEPLPPAAGELQGGSGGGSGLQQGGSGPVRDESGCCLARGSKRGGPVVAVALATLRPLVTPLPAVPRVIIDGGSLLVDAFNANFLAVFVFANLLVGVTNLLVETIDSPAPVAVALLLAYAAAICCAAVCWRLCRVSLKVW